MLQIKRKKMSKFERMNQLKSQLFVTRLGLVIMTVLCCVLLYQNQTMEDAFEEEKKQIEIAHEEEIEYIEMENAKAYDRVYSDYNLLSERYGSFVNTIDELTSISQTLDEENQYLIDSMELMEAELEEFRSREELYDRYEYALYYYGERNDITFNQLRTLEELVEDSSIQDEDLILAWILTESGGNETARNSESTAKGYGQFLNGTSEFVYTNLMGRSGWNANVALDGETNLEMMVAYIDYLYEINDGNLYEIIRDYRGKQDVSGYISRIDSYLEKVDKSVHDIYLSLQ